MKETCKKVPENSGLQFFGKVTASVSHEIKNVLAIINENAGLLEDLSRIAEKREQPLDIERVRTLAGKVQAQVLRGNGIVNNMNRFAHSIDRLIEQVDLNEVLALITDLAGRHASMKGVTLKAEASTEKITVTTNPFLLENLLWACLNFVMESESCPETIGITALSVQDGARIRFSGLRDMALPQDDTISKKVMDAIIGALEGDLKIVQGEGEIIIDLPENISGA